MKHTHLAAAPRRSAPLARWLGLVIGLVLMSLWAVQAHAADPVDPPGRVGRLSEIDGRAWIYTPDSNEWIDAVRNRPVTTGDRVSTEADGRAEVRIGTTVLRLGPSTELEVLAIDDEQVSVQLHAGVVAARLRSNEAAREFVLYTDEGRFRAERSGSYRFDRSEGTSSATALSGEALYEGPGRTGLKVQQGQRVEFWIERSAPQYSITNPVRDNFGAWVASLDARDEGGVSTRYVSAEMTGVEDLDRYGRWVGQTEYGPVWIPHQVAPGWAPYRVGHWVWIRPWGWTWVDDSPWGFAPFHYGRWVWFRNAWCWAPGRYVARPVYAPALVAWMGGPGVSVSVTIGGGPNVGWFPLGPREVFVPGYRVTPRYVQNVNITHVTRITNVNTIVNNPAQFMAGTRYVNRGLPHAVTVVPSQVVERRQPVAPAYRPVNDRTLRELVRERPRAEPSVNTPPRWAPGSRVVTDPRTARPAPPREAAPRPPSMVSPRSPEVRPQPRPQDPRDSRDSRDGRERDRPGVVSPGAPNGFQRPGRDDRDDNRGNDRGNQRRPGDDPRTQAPRPGFVTPPPPAMGGARSEERAPRVVEPPREERRRRHEDDMPQPAPRPSVQAPARAPEVRVAPPPAQQPSRGFEAAPQVQRPAPPPQVARPAPPPPQVFVPAPQQPQPGRPEPRQRGTEERERPDRQDRSERSERR